MLLAMSDESICERLLAMYIASYIDKVTLWPQLIKFLVMSACDITGFYPTTLILVN